MSGAAGQVGPESMIVDTWTVSQAQTQCLSLHWEFMFCASLHQTPGLIEQSRLLNRVR